jgi:hypothetical protein
MKENLKHPSGRPVIVLDANNFAQLASPPLFVLPATGTIGTKRNHLAVLTQ